MVDDNEIRFILGRLEGKMDSLISQMRSLGENIANHESRLQELEKSKAWILGVSAALSGAIAFLFNILK